MSQIHDLFRKLANGDETVIAAIDILESDALPGKEAKLLAHQVWTAIVPNTPEGHRHSRDSFWGIASERSVWKGLYGYKAYEHGKWMAENAHNEKRTVFVPMPNIPQPRVGIW